MQKSKLVFKVVASLNLFSTLASLLTLVLLAIGVALIPNSFTIPGMPQGFGSKVLFGMLGFFAIIQCTCLIFSIIWMFASFRNAKLMKAVIFGVWLQFIVGFVYCACAALLFYLSLISYPFQSMKKKLF